MKFVESLLVAAVAYTYPDELMTGAERPPPCHFNVATGCNVAMFRVVKAPAVATYTRLHDAAAETMDWPGRPRWLLSALALENPARPPLYSTATSLPSGNRVGTAATTPRLPVESTAGVKFGPANVSRFDLSLVAATTV